jgi:hypothetical protein
MAGDGLATGLANSWLDTLANTAYSQTVTYIQLHTGDPGAAGTANISVGSTTRVVLAWSAAAAGSKAITTTLPVWTNGGTTETITNITGWTLATAGVFKFSITLTASKAWGSGDTLTLNTCTISLTPLAS